MADFEVRVFTGDGPTLTGLGAYYLTDYLDAVRKTFRGAVELYEVSSGGQTRALFPLLRDGNIGILPLLGQYWGIWDMPPTDPAPGRAESIREKTARAVDEYLRELGLAEATFIHPPHVTDARPFLRLGWEVTPRYTYLVRPSGEADWDSATRRQLKKSRESGVVVRVARSWEGIYRMYREGMTRQRLPHAPEALVKELASSGKIYETDTAAVLFGKDAAAGYYTLAASDPAGHGDGSPTALVARVLEDLAKDGLSLDFVGANTEKLCRFKRGFGGRLVPYFQTRAVFTKTRKFLKGMRRVLRGD